MLLRCYPKADIVSIRELVEILAIMSEGTLVLYRTRKERAVKIERVIEICDTTSETYFPEHLTSKKGLLAVVIRGVFRQV